MGKRKRSYDASRRRERALESQQRVLEAARRLFAERGYAETTMEAIAAEAGMALPTLYAAFQSKHGVLFRLLDRLVSGTPKGPLLDTPGARAVRAERDARRALTLFVADLDKVQTRAIPTYEVVKNAARTEPEVAKILERMQRYRFSNLEALAAHLDELRALRKGMSVVEAAWTLWALTSPEVRQMLLIHGGWPVERYHAWLEETLSAALLRA